MDFFSFETKFQELKGQFEAGGLTEEEFKAQLQDLMIQDEKGQWWMIGYESGQWHFHDGEKWVQKEPPTVTKRRREQAEALCQEGVESLSAGNWEIAVEKFEAALALEPKLPEATTGLAEAKMRLEEASKPAAPEEPQVPPAEVRPEAKEVLKVAPAAPERMVGETRLPSAVPEPEMEVEPEVLPTASRPKWGRWLAVAIIGVILVVIVIVLLGGQPSDAPEPEVRFWVDHEVIARGDCTVLHWETSGLETVHIAGPGFDADQPLPPGGEGQICLEATSGFELFHPDMGTLGFLEVHVQE
jgi:hypothetical protein